MVYIAENPFKDREEVKKEIRICALWGHICSVLGFIFVLLGIIWEVLKIDFGLASISWFLLAIFFALSAVIPQMRYTIDKHLLGIESESKKK